tara:strand:- start:382 stop:624 length:243 start_codon:yes stop_codon:yes gene_type:complete
MVCLEALARLATASTLNPRQPFSAISVRVASRMAALDASLRVGPFREDFLVSVGVGMNNSRFVGRCDFYSLQTANIRAKW